MLSVGPIDVFSEKGIGIFKSSNGSWKLPFTLHRQLTRCIITLEEQLLGNEGYQSCEFNLNGNLADGRLVKVQSLKRVFIEEESIVELIPWGCNVEIGNKLSESIESIEYVLLGIYSGSFRISYSGWHIELKSEKDTLEKLRIFQALKLPLEGSLLTISSNSKSLVEYERYTSDIIKLLSLAQGIDIWYSRYFVTYACQGMQEIWRNGAAIGVGPTQIINAGHFGAFLKQCLPNWSAMSSEEQKTFSIAISSLNSTGSGYLESRLLKACTIWEYLASKYIPPATLSKEVKQLRLDLMRTTKEWRKQNKSLDPHGFYSDRVAKIFGWCTLKYQIEEFARSSGLDLDKIPLNLDMLKAARDSAGHKITLESVNAYDGSRDKIIEFFELLLKTQFGLQLVILMRLGYEGTVEIIDNGWSDCKSISSFYHRSSFDESSSAQ